MAYWKTGYRKIGGKRRKVRELVRGGRVVAVRLYGRPHYTDKTAHKYGLKREKGYYNATNRSSRTNYTIHDHYRYLYQ